MYYIALSNQTVHDYLRQLMITSNLFAVIIIYDHIWLLIFVNEYLWSSMVKYAVVFSGFDGTWRLLFPNYWFSIVLMNFICLMFFERFLTALYYFRCYFMILYRFNGFDMFLLFYGFSNLFNPILYKRIIIYAQTC